MDETQQSIERIRDECIAEEEQKLGEFTCKVVSSEWNDPLDYRSDPAYLDSFVA